MSWAMIQKVGADGREKLSFPVESYEKAWETVATSQYLALRALDMFVDVRVEGVLESSPNGLPINPEACGLIRHENKLRQGAVFDLDKTYDSAHQSAVSMAGSVPELFAEESLAVDYVVIKQALSQHPLAVLTAKAKSLIALAESIEDKSFADIEINSDFLQRLGIRQMRDHEAWLSSAELSQRLHAELVKQSVSISETEQALLSTSQELMRIETGVAQRLVALSTKREQEGDGASPRLLAKVSLADRARLHLHRLFSGVTQAPSELDVSGSALLIELAQGHTQETEELEQGQTRMKRLRDKLDADLLRHTETKAALEECLRAQDNIKDLAAMGKFDKAQHHADRSVENATKQANVLLFHAMADGQGTGKDGFFESPVDEAVKVHAIETFNIALCCSSYRLDTPTFMQGSMMGPRATCVLIGSGTIEKVYTKDGWTSSSANDPSTRGAANQSSAEMVAMMSSNLSRDGGGYNEVVVTSAKPIALFKNFDSMFAGAPEGGSPPPIPPSKAELLAEINQLLNTASTPLPGGECHDPLFKLPSLVLSGGRIFRLEEGHVAARTLAEMASWPEPASSADALKLIGRAYRMREVKNQCELIALASEAPPIGEDQRLRAAGALIE